MASDIKLLYVTCKDLSQAKSMGRELVTLKLAACVNILPKMESIYSWNNKIESSEESVLIVKTTDALTGACAAKIKSLHTYEVPCILQLDVMGGNADYISWLKDQTLPP